MAEKTTKQIRKEMGTALMAEIKGAKPAVDLLDFKNAVIGLFDETLIDEDIETQTRHSLARLRARIEIELQSITQ